MHKNLSTWIMDAPEEDLSPLGPSINYVIKRDRQAIRQKKRHRQREDFIKRRHRPK